MSNAQCGSCHGEFGKCPHTAGLTLPAYMSATPAQAAEATQKDYVPAQRAVEVHEESEPYKGPSFAYGPAGPEGRPGKDSVVPGPPGRDGKDGKNPDPKEIVELSQRVMREFFDTQLRAAVETFIRSFGDLRGKQGEKGESIVGPVGKNGVDGQSIVGPAGKNGVDGHPGRDADPTQIIAQATRFLEDAFRGFKAEVRSALSETVVAQLKSSGVIDANGKAVLIPGPQGLEGLRGPEAKPPDLSRAAAVAERAMRAEMVAMKDEILATLRAELLAVPR